MVNCVGRNRIWIIGIGKSANRMIGYAIGCQCSQTGIASPSKLEWQAAVVDQFGDCRAIAFVIAEHASRSQGIRDWRRAGGIARTASAFAPATGCECQYK